MNDAVMQHFFAVQQTGKDNTQDVV